MKSEDLEICIKKLRDGIQQLGSITVPLAGSANPFQGLSKVVEVHNFMVELKDQQIKEVLGGELPPEIQPKEPYTEFSG